MTAMEEANKWWFSSEEKTKEQIERKLEAAKSFLRAMTKAELKNLGKRLNTLDDLSKIKAASREQKLTSGDSSVKKRRKNRWRGSEKQRSVFLER